MTSRNGASPCQVCESARYSSVLLRLPNGSYAKCSRCGFVYLNGERSLAEQHDIYQTDQFEGEGYMGTFDMTQIAAEQVESVHSILRRAGAPANFWTEDLPHLDIGCARGYFLRSFLDATGRKHSMGVDVSPGMTEWGRREFGLDLRTGAIEHKELPEGQYGFITMFDVLEHVAFPRQVLQKLIRALAPGGWMVIEVPSETTVFRLLTQLGHRLTGGRLLGPIQTLYHPFHLSYFTAGSLQRLVQSLGGCHVTTVTKEAHITRFGLGRYPVPARIAIRSVSLVDKVLGTEAKLLCSFQAPGL